MKTSFNIFVSCAAEDHHLCEELKKQLAALIRRGFISWSDHRIAPGREWEKEIRSRLESADIILLLVSADFLASDYCYSVEMTYAMERHYRGEARVIPILLRSVDWNGTPFGTLQPLPINGVPVTHAQWGTLDEAFYAVAQSLRQMVEEDLPHVSQKAAVSDAVVSLNQSPSHMLPRVWNVPYLPNPFFTGREDVLLSLYEALHAKSSHQLAQPHILSGLGGIGKTHLAVEYTYKYFREYEFILWARADTRETLTSDFVTLATMLGVSSREDQDQNHAINAVKYWLSSHTTWLLILDNAEDLTAIMDFIPATSQGHMLLTTRAHSVGGVALQTIIEKMSFEEGALFLLRRAKVLLAEASLNQAQNGDREAALKIAETLDGLPLAIDQAGAYIEETGSSLSDYLHLYQTQRSELLRLRGDLVSSHPESVVTAWSLSFARIVQASLSAVELLRFCAFLQPDHIPEEMIMEGASELGSVLGPVASDPFQLNAAIRELLKYSFIRRYRDSKTLAIHRLLQDVIQDEMDEEVKHEWAVRTVRAMNRAFPDVEYQVWQNCQRCLPHVHLCSTLIDQWNMTFAEATRLLNLTSVYLCDRAQYTQALPFCQQALAIREQALGQNHLDVAQSLNTLAAIYRGLDKYKEAEESCERALAIRKHILGPEHLDVAQSLNDLAWIYIDHDMAARAESICQQALAIRERILGSEHLAVAESLNCLAWLYDDRCMFSLVEPNYQRALTIRESVLGPVHPKVGETLNNLGWYYRVRRRYDQAQQYFERALTIRRQTLGSLHPDVASTLNNLARMYIEQHKYDQVEAFLQEALDIQKKTLGIEHRKTIQTFSSLAKLYSRLRLFSQAEMLFQQSLTLRERMLGLDHPKVATSLHELAELYLDQGDANRALPLLERALEIAEEFLGPDHLVTLAIVENRTIAQQLLTYYHDKP